MVLFNVCCQLDFILIWVVKKCVVFFVFIIIVMINLFFDNGYVFESWKVVFVVLFIKKFGLDFVFENFCFVSNVFFVFKIVEKLVIL